MRRITCSPLLATRTTQLAPVILLEALNPLTKDKNHPTYFPYQFLRFSCAPVLHRGPLDRTLSGGVLFWHAACCRGEGKLRKLCSIHLGAILDRKSDPGCSQVARAKLSFFLHWKPVTRGPFWTAPFISGALFPRPPTADSDDHWALPSKSTPSWAFYTGRSGRGSP